MADIIHTSQKDGVWDDYWAGRSVEKGLDLCLSDELLPIFERYLPEDGLILEAGCGLGKWVIFFKNKGYKMIGLDGNFRCLAQIKKYSGETKLIAADVKSLSVKTESLDAYISLGVIEHFQDGPIEALKEARRVLKPEGLVFIEVPHLNLIRRIILPFKKIYRYTRKIINRVPRDYHFAHYIYTKDELRNFLIAAGFEIIFTQPKDDISFNRSIGLWLDFPILRDKSKDDCEHALSLFGMLVSIALNYISPWICSACVVCIGRPVKTDKLIS